MEKAINNLGKYLDSVYNHGARWNVGKINPTLNEVTQLYDTYKWLVHDHIEPNKCETISKNVADALKYFGFKVVEKGIGWAIAE